MQLMCIAASGMCCVWQDRVLKRRVGNCRAGKPAVVLSSRSELTSARVAQPRAGVNAIETFFGFLLAFELGMDGLGPQQAGQIHGSPPLSIEKNPRPQPI